MKTNNIHPTPQPNNINTSSSYKASVNYSSPYLPPSHQLTNHLPNYADDLERRFPQSHKYEYSPLIRSPISAEKKYQNYQMQNPIQIEELKLIISQLRSSLKASQNNQQRLQEDLCLQRSKNCDQIQKRRRLEEELKRMEFQLERVGNYETLGIRQAGIKLQALMRENSKLSFQVNDLLEQIKNIKQQKRKVMTECDSMIKDRQVLAAENQALQSKLNALELEIHQVKRQISQANNQHIPSRINEVLTGRSQRMPTREGSPGVGSINSIEEIDYEEENQKLLQDYQKLMVENESMKRLYQQFYKPPNEQSQRAIKSSTSPNHNQLSELKGSGSFSNKRLAQQLSQSQAHANDQIQLMLKTTQKQQIAGQLTLTRDEAINQLLKCYQKAIERSQKQRKNSLKLFTEGLNKKILTYSKMAQNYLQMRATIKQQANISFPQDLNGITPHDQNQRKILSIYKSVKESAKGQKQTGLRLAVFRLLTLLSKFKNMNDLILSNMKHSTLKYIYKMTHLQQNRYQIS